MEYPLVSAVVLCYNHARFVVECLESVKLQNYPNLELIVSDDASRDNSAELIQAWLAENKTIPHRFIHNKANLGLCRSLNNALAHAHGKYFSGVAADDAWLPGKLLHQVKVMEGLPESVGVVYSDALRVDEDGNSLPPTFMQATLRNCQLLTAPQGNIQVALWTANFVAPMTTLIRRECFNRVGVFDETKFAEDWDMWLRISRHYNFFYCPETSAKYRKVGGSMCNAQSGRLIDDENQTCVKHLRTGDLAPEARAAATMKLYNLAIHSYEQKTSKFKGNLLNALRFVPTPGLALRCVFALCGIGPEHFANARSACQWLNPISILNPSHTNRNAIPNRSFEKTISASRKSL